AITNTLHILLINVCAKITLKNHLKKADFCMLFCFCETASKDNVTVAVISIVTQKWFSNNPGWFITFN
ncbi:hypothetical protein, partial [Escherichia coli]|uniref:hypothetical protein n=3 Tax=Escherichia coli TaxID=562 RepID=UPI0039E0C832